jgi:nitrogen regulatory protein P-II 2
VIRAIRKSIVAANKRSVKIKVAVATDQVNRIIDAITGAAKTGEIGDGKIFVLDLESAVRIRTGETDAAAI